MSPRHRFRRGGLKFEHAIISGGERILEALASREGIRLVVPGEIHQARHGQFAQIKPVYPTHNGMKCRLYSGGLVQEVFVVGNRQRICEAIESLNAFKDLDRILEATATR